MQSAHFDRVMTVKKIPPENEFCDSPEDLIEKVLTIMQQGPITIDSKVALKKFLLFSFYLRKLTYCDLQFVSK